MKRLQRAALLAELVERMHANNSWCGETHLQKATFFLQELLGVDLGYDFILYKHGPFSFDLRDELSDFAADKLIRYQPQLPPYGPRITVTTEGKNVQGMYPKMIGGNADKIAFVADKLDARGVQELERLATALFLTLDAPDAAAEKRAEALRNLKPHIPEPAALRAVNEVDEIRNGAVGLAA